MSPEEQEEKHEDASEEAEGSDRIALQLRPRGTEEADPASKTEADGASEDDQQEDGEGYALDGATLDDVFEVVCGMEEVFESVREPLRRIEADLVARINADKAKDKAFDTLYEEMRQYKENFLLQAQKPLFLDMILLFDQIQRAAESVEDEAGQEAIENIKEELLEILYRRDVEPMEFDGDARFDRQWMKAIERIDTDDEAEDKTIDRVSRSGFKWNDNVLRPHEVVVKRYSKADTSNEKEDKE